MADGEIVPKDVQAAAEAGKAPAVTAAKALEGDGLEQIAAIAKDKISEVGRLDEHPTDGKPSGKVDEAIAALMKVEKDKVTGNSYRRFDLLKNADDQRFIAELCDKRYNTKDRRINIREVQRVRDVCAKVDIGW